MTIPARPLSCCLVLRQLASLHPLTDALRTPHAQVMALRRLGVSCGDLTTLTSQEDANALIKARGPLALPLCCPWLSHNNNVTPEGEGGVRTAAPRSASPWLSRFAIALTAAVVALCRSSTARRANFGSSTALPRRLSRAKNSLQSWRRRTRRVALQTGGFFPLGQPSPEPAGHSLIQHPHRRRGG